MTILFADLRGFSGIAETLKDDPQQLTAIINRVLTLLSQAVLDHGGTIDKYIGDCIMAFWGAPLATPAHAEDALAAAISMLERMQIISTGTLFPAGKKPMLEIGIGIASGRVVVGNMGSAMRFDYTVIGDTVNLAARLQEATRRRCGQLEYPLLMTAATAERIIYGEDTRGLKQRCRQFGSIQVKGRKDAVEIWGLAPAGNSQKDRVENDQRQ